MAATEAIATPTPVVAAEKKVIGTLAGDPTILGLPTFVAGSVALGLTFTG